MDESGSLRLPHVRRDLMLYLAELAADDPRAPWRKQQEEGLPSGIDEVFHFFFDDHDLDDGAVGRVFFNGAEVAAVGAVKSALEAVLDDIGDQGDDEFVRHPLWRNVTDAARTAQAQLDATI